MRLLSNILFVVSAIFILACVGLYLFSTAQIAEAPVMDVGSVDTAESVVMVSVNSFEECAAVGNPVMMSSPAQCRHNGVLYTEEAVVSAEPQEGETVCSPESKLAEVCTMEYAPVCGLVQVQCVTTPCNHVPETFSNDCMACAQENVISYKEGECSLEVQ